MIYLAAAITFFIISVIIHIRLCRSNVSNQLLAKAFCSIAMVNLVVCAIAFAVLEKSFPYNGCLWFLPLMWTSLFMYVLLVPVYLVFYVSTELMSPTKKILLYIQTHGHASDEDLSKIFTDEDLIRPRLNDLVSTACVRNKDGLYSLLPAGQQISKALNCYQIILGRGMGG
jgi:hypothetical protein